VSIDWKRLLRLSIPYLLVFWFFNRLGEGYRLAAGADALDKAFGAFATLGDVLGRAPFPSLHPSDLLWGVAGTAAVWAVVQFKRKSGKKFRQGEEYGSARWGTRKDIQPFIDPKFERNILLTQTERIMMGRNKNPKYNINKNVLVIGGSGSGKTRFHVKPNLMQMNASYVVTDPKGLVY